MAKKKIEDNVAAGAPAQPPRLRQLYDDAAVPRLQKEFDGYLERMLKKYPPTQKLGDD